MTKVYSCFVLFGLFAVVASTGCGNPDAAMKMVTGVVTYDGKTVDGAMVQFAPVTPEVGEVASGITDASGVYTLTSTTAQKSGSGAIPGKYKVTVSKMEEIPKDPSQIAYDKGEIDYPTYMKQMEDKRNETVKRAPPKSLVPAKYKLISDTPLEFTVENKKNVIDIQLVD